MKNNQKEELSKRLKKLQETAAYTMFKVSSPAVVDNLDQSYKTELDTQIKAYLSLYQDGFEIFGISSWHKFIYLMTDELLRKGLKNTDKMHIKQKYAEFKCYVVTDDMDRHVEFVKIISTYTRLMDSICHKCYNYGELETINGLDVRLCSKHYAHAMNQEYKMPANPTPQIAENQYRFASDSEFNRLNDRFNLIKLAMLRRTLEENNIETSVIQQILLESLEVLERFELDDKFYSATISFKQEDGGKVPSSNDFYSNKDYLAEVINKHNA